MHVHPELLLKIRAVHMTKLHLKYELSYHTFIISRCEGAPNRKRTLLYLQDVGIPIMLVLIMGAVDMGKRGDTQSDHVSAFPQEIAVNKMGLRRIPDCRIGAADGVTNFLQF